MRRLFCVSALSLVLTLTASFVLLSGEPVQAASKEKPIILTLNNAIPPVHTRWQKALKPWCDEVAKRTNNRVQIKPYFAQALSSMAENYDSVVKGVADMAECAIGLKPGRLPLMEQLMYFCRPSISLKNSSQMMMQMYREMPELQNEFKDTKLLFLHMSGNMGFGTTNKKIDSMEDMQGLKMCVIGSGLLMDKFKALGFSTVFMPLSDIYMALERGVVDGSHLSFDLCISRRWGDMIKYINPITMNTPNFYMVMNKKKWNSLPPDIQKVFEDLSGEYAARQFDDYWETAENAAQKKFETELGGETIIFSEEEMEKIDNTVLPVINKFVEESGIDGLQKVYNRFTELEKKHAMR